MTAVTDKTRKLIAKSKSQPSVSVRINDIQQPEGFQKRSASIENQASRRAIREKEVEVVEKMTSDLMANSEHHADPVTVCRVNGKLILVDGYHRCEAYQKAGRHSVPARVVDCSESEAHLLATILNGFNATIPLGKEERGNMVWKEVLRLYDGSKWADGLSARKLAELMGVSAKTVDRMVVTKKQLGDEASGMTWREARLSSLERPYSAEDRLIGWLTALDKVNVESEHEQEVLLQMFRVRLESYSTTKEELAERFARYLDDPKAFEKYRYKAMREDMFNF